MGGVWLRDKKRKLPKSVAQVCKEESDPAHILGTGIEMLCLSEFPQEVKPAYYL